MARPQKHNWNLIQKYYEAGMTQTEITKKFNISKGTLSEKVKLEKWGVSEQVTERINNVVTASKAVSELPAQEQRIATEIIEEKLKRNKAIDGTAFKLLKKTLALIDDAETLKDMKDGAEAVIRIKEVLLPESKKPEIMQEVNLHLNNANVQQNITTQEEAAKVYMDLIGK